MLEHPETIIFFSTIYGPVRERHIWAYYDLIRPNIFPELLGYPLLLYIATSRDEYVIKRKSAGQYISISSEEDFDQLNNGRTVEFHISTPIKSSLQWIDIDPGDEVSFSDVKSLTREILEVLHQLDCDTPRVLFTGSRGFYIEVKFGKSLSPDKARELFSDLLADFVEKSNLSESVVFSKPNANQIRIDFSPVKKYGSHRSPFSLACTKAPGFVCVPIDLGDLMSFKKEVATMTNVVKKFTGKKLVID